MKRMRTRILRSAGLAGVAAAAVLVLAPAADAGAVSTGDGSVRTVTSTIAVSAWRSIGTPQGGEIVSDF